MRSTPALPSMHHPQRWIALLRMVVGAWFVKSLFTKLTIGLAWGVVPLPMAAPRWVAVMPKLLARYAAENPIDWYRSFLLDTVIPHAHLFAHLTALGESAIGLSLLFGIVTRLGAFFGALQVIFYGLAVQHMSSGQQGFHVMLLSMMIAFLFARAGRYWGIDGRLIDRHPRSLWAALG